MATFVAVPLAAGGFAPVNPETVDTIEDVPASLNPGPAACFVSFIAASGFDRITAAGTAPTIAALLATPAPPSGPTLAFGGYSPAGTAQSGPISLIAGFAANWHQIGNVVALSAQFDLSFASSGVCSFSFPPPVQAPLLFQTRGAATSTDSPYTGGASSDPPAIVEDSGADFLVTLTNNTGGPKRVSVVLMYLTP